MLDIAGGLFYLLQFLSIHPVKTKEEVMKKIQIGAIALALVSVLLASCQPQTDVAAVRKTIEEASAASAQAMMTGDVEKSVANYADDAISMPPNNEPLKGKEAIKAWTVEMSKMAKMTAVNFGTVEVDASGNIAYEVGTYDMTMEMPGMGEMRDKGKYMSIWKKQSDGSWKVHADIWNTNTPMPMPEPPKKGKK